MSNLSRTTQKFDLILALEKTSIGYRRGTTFGYCSHQF